MLKPIKILGVPCYPLSNEEHAGRLLADFVLSSTGGVSLAVNAEKIYRCNSDEEFKESVSHFTLPYPDGAGAVLAFSWMHGIKVTKINMPMVALKMANKYQWKIAIVGAEKAVNENAVSRIVQEYTSLRIVYASDGYRDLKLIESEVIKSNPHLVMLAMGSPKQEEFAFGLMKKLDSSFFVLCGGALDILSGRKKRAHPFLVNNNLEWFYRLLKEPSRIRRQLVLPKFLFLLVSEFIKKKKQG